MDSSGSDEENVVDSRILYSIGSGRALSTDGQLYNPTGLAFDGRHDLLAVVDGWNHRLQVFVATDGSFIDKLGSKQQLAYPHGIAFDHERGTVLVIDTDNDRIQSWSLTERRLLSVLGKRGAGEREFHCPKAVAIDERHHRVLIADDFNHRVQVLSSRDLSFLFSLGTGKQSKQPGEMYRPAGVAVDCERDRTIVADTENNRMQVFSSIDGSFLFEFGWSGTEAGQLDRPRGVCLDNQGRIIVADSGNCRLQAFTHEGHHISSFEWSEACPLAVAFDEHRGLIAFSADNRVRVIGANQWLPNTFTWRPDRHRYAPSWIKQAVEVMTMIRSVVDDSASMSMIPNELLFEIFSFL